MDDSFGVQVCEASNDVAEIHPCNLHEVECNSSSVASIVIYAALEYINILDTNPLIPCRHLLVKRDREEKRKK